MTQHITPEDAQFPDTLRAVQPAITELFVASKQWQDIMQRPIVAIVGSRRASAYGQHVTQSLAGQLARAGVVVASGMAIGIDGIAHRAALAAGGQTIAVLPSGLDAPYPARHQGLAREIYERGGALITEYPKGSTPYPMHFIARNRIIAALANIVLITEAARKSGSLHTAQFALELGREVAAVPGDITRPTSEGANDLIQMGATPISKAEDITQLLGIKLIPQHTAKGETTQEQAILDNLAAHIYDGTELLTKSKLNVTDFNQALTMLEIRGIIRPLGNNQWSLT